MTNSIITNTSAIVYMAMRPAQVQPGHATVHCEVTIVGQP